MTDKAEGAFRTIGELSAELGLPQHILRYWETRFPQLRPLTRAGNRRYYRPVDVALVKRINSLLNVEGYTVRGVQKLLASRDGEAAAPAPVAPPPAVTQSAPVTTSGVSPVMLGELRAVRDRLAAALAAN